MGAADCLVIGLTGRELEQVYGFPELESPAAATAEFPMPEKPPTQFMAIDRTVPDSTVIWRYFKFERFIDILESHCLWFSRPFLFDDKWEGRYPPSYDRQMRRYASDEGIPFDEFEQDFRRRLLRHQYAHFVNCWHICDCESEAMWASYASSTTGIAIQSTVGDVKTCLRPHNFGKVIYYEPSHDVRTESIFGPNDILFKRKSFSREQEYRFWFDDDELLQKIEAGGTFRPEDLSGGELKSVSDMPKLIKKLVVAPRASKEFVAEVRMICTDRRRRWLANLVELSANHRHAS